MVRSPGLLAAIATGSLVAAIAPGHAADPVTTQPAVQHELVTRLETKPVEYRKSVKQALQAHMDALGLIVTLRSPHTENLQPHADALAWLAKAHEDLYPEGTQGPGTRPSIWQEREPFAAAGKKTAAAAARLQTAVRDGNRHLILNSLVQLGESCEGCHTRFRQPAG